MTSHTAVLDLLVILLRIPVYASKSAKQEQILDKAIGQVMTDIGPNCAPALTARIKDKRNWSVIGMEVGLECLVDSMPMTTTKRLPKCGTSIHQL